MYGIGAIADLFGVYLTAAVPAAVPADIAAAVAASAATAADADANPPQSPPAPEPEPTAVVEPPIVVAVEDDYRVDKEDSNTAVTTEDELHRPCDNFCCNLLLARTLSTVFALTDSISRRICPPVERR